MFPSSIELANGRYIRDNNHETHEILFVYFVDFVVALINPIFEAP